MYWRHMSAWMLHVAQTSFSRQATSPTPLSAQQPLHLNYHPHHSFPSKHPYAPHEWNSKTLPTGVNQFEGLNTLIKSVSLYFPPSPPSTAILRTRGLSVPWAGISSKLLDHFQELGVCISF